MVRRFVAASVLVLVACAPKPETPEQAAARMRAEADSAKVAIEAANARFARFIAEGKADSAALNYAEDAVVMSPNMPPTRGRAAIQALFEQMIGWGTLEMAPTTENVDANGPLAVERGSAVENLKPGPHAPAGLAAMFPDTVKYLTEWKKVGGSWVIANDINNSNRALPAPGAKRR